MLSPEVADRIAARAKERGLTLEALSMAAGLHRSTAAKVIRRVRAGEEVGATTLARIAGALDVSLRWLLFGDSTPDLHPLRSAPGWDAAARDAIALGCAPRDVDAVGAVATPERLDAITALQVVDLVRALRRRT